MRSDSLTGRLSTNPSRLNSASVLLSFQIRYVCVYIVHFIQPTRTWASILINAYFILFCYLIFVYLLALAMQLYHLLLLHPVYTM